jgi:hypothetical protein
LLMTMFAGLPVADRVASGDIVVEGDPSLYEALMGLIEPIVTNFPVVTP